MLLILGLGNPDKKYEHTRHNVGFDVLNIISQKLNIPINKRKCKALVGEGKIENEKVVLALPQTYMNLSGQSLVELMNWYKIKPERVLIVFDDVDIPFSSIRIRPNGSAGTHNGMRNIIELTASNNFPRIRVGIGKPPQGYDMANWVLSSYNNKEDREKIFEAYMLAADLAIMFANNGIDAVRSYLSKQQANKTENNDAK